MLSPPHARPPPRSRWLYRSWWAALAVYGAAASAFLLLALVLGDRTWWLYTGALFAFWLLAPAVPGAVLAAWRRRRVVFAALLAPALVWLWTFGPALLPPAPFQGAPGADLRLAAFNVSLTPRVEHVVALQRRTRADVLLLQEVTPAARRALDRELPELAHRWFAPISTLAAGNGGVAVLSRYPITSVEPVDGLPRGARPTAVVGLDVGRWRLDVLSVHLSSPCRDCLLTDREQISAISRRRVREAARLAELVRGRRIVVAGDLNSGALNEPRRLLRRAGLRDAQRDVGWGPGFTRGSQRTVTRIDWILTGPGVVPVSAWVDEPGRSDHRPVVADLALVAT